MIRFRHTVLLLLLLQACAAAPTRTTSVEPLVGSWQLAVAAPAGARIPTLSVGRDGAVSGNAGVNKYNTSIDVGALAAGHFRLGPAMCTRMAGTQEAMQLEASFLQALSAADAAMVGSSTLVLQQGDRPLLEFTRVAGR